MTKCKPGILENQISHIFNYFGGINYDIRKTAYHTIAASGRNAATLHYVINNKEIKEN